MNIFTAIDEAGMLAHLHSEAIQIARKANAEVLTIKEQWKLIDFVSSKAILNDGGIEDTYYYVNPQLSLDNIPNRLRYGQET